MDFGSKYVYNYSDSEEECVSDDEYEQGMSRQLNDGDGESESRGGLDGATSEDVSAAKSAASGGKNMLRRLFSAGSRSRDSKPTEPSIKKKKMPHWLSLGSQYERREEIGYRAPKGKRWRRADTNVITVKFDKLKAPSNMHTGDPFYCNGCNTVLSKRSKLESMVNDDIRKWKCEFCGVVNDVDLVDEEIPQNEDTTFMLTPAPSTASSGRKGEDDTLVIFCVDVSGSMCITTEVSGKINFRGSHLDRLQSLNESRESQYLPRQKHNVTYVSRLQSVQAAVDHQLGEMQKEHPNRRAVLITFNSEVTVHGDGSSEPVHISGDKLNSKEELIKIGSEIGMPKQVKDSRDLLGNKVFDLEEGGQTALGPAVLVAVSMACQVPGSKVIVCTDGMANVGLGTLDNEAVYDSASTFYDVVSEQASDKGIAVSVISIKGTDCKMVELGKVADATGGQVNIVDPLKLTQQFGSILADPIIATNVSATLQLHRGLYFRFEESEQSKITRFVGNVTKESEVTFEYGIRKEFKRKQKAKDARDQNTVSIVMEQDEEVVYDNPQKEAVYDNTEGVKKETIYDNMSDVKSAAKVESNAASTSTANTVESDFHELKELPFQLRIIYTDLEGGQALRVITQSMPVTKDRAVAERAMNMAAVGSHATKTSASLALQGDYTTSRLNAFMYQRLLHRKATRSSAAPEDACVYENFSEAAIPMENQMNFMQAAERSNRGMTYSDEENSDEDEADGEVLAAAAAPTKKKKVPTATLR